MYGLKIELQDAQEVKKKLIASNNLNNKLKPKKNNTHIIFPLNHKIDDARLIEEEFEENKEKILTLKDALKKELNKKELELLKTSYDQLGNIAILEIDKELRPKENLIAKKLLEINKKIKTVLRKDDKHQGPYRIQKFKYLEGIDTTTTIHTENSVKIELDIQEMYFSPRLSNDRKRIAKQIKKNETIVVIGSGCGPYPLVFSKHSKAKKIIGIEINPNAHTYAQKNKEINKSKNTEFLLTDGKKYLKENQGFDKIILATPDNSNDFIKEALNALNKKGIIYYNFFAKEEELEQKEQELTKIANTLNKKINVTFVKNGKHAPYIYRISADIKSL